MRHCPLCSQDFPEGTPMKMARGSNICLPCAETPRGQREVNGWDERYQGYRPGASTGRGEASARARYFWQTGHRAPSLYEQWKAEQERKK